MSGRRPNKSEQTTTIANKKKSASLRDSLHARGLRGRGGRHDRGRARFRAPAQALPKAVRQIVENLKAMAGEIEDARPADRPSAKPRPRRARDPQAQCGRAHRQERLSGADIYDLDGDGTGCD